MNELIQWYEDRYDPDELVDVLDISVSDLVRKFYERAYEHKLLEQNGAGEEEPSEQEGL